MISRRLKATWMATSLIIVLILSISGNFVAAQCYETESNVPATVRTTSTTTAVTTTATATTTITTTTTAGTTINTPTAKTDGKKPTAKTEATGPKKVIRTAVNYSFTENEIRMLQQVVYREAGGVSVECQQAVCSVIINSMMVNHLTLYEEISAVNRYEVFPDCLYCEPSEETCDSVLDVLYNGTTLPRNVLYFREGHYSDFGYGIDEPYCSIDNVYFSLNNQVEA